MYSTITNFTKDKKTIKKYLPIDSIFRNDPETTLSTYFNYKLKEPLTNVVSMNIQSIEIPENTIYPVSEHNGSNFFFIELSGNNYKIIIDSGFYNESSITDNIQNCLHSVSDLSSISFSIDPLTRKSIFSTNSPDISFSFSFCSLTDDVTDLKKYDQTLGGFLGFRTNENYILSSTLKIISESPFGIHLHKYIFLSINDFTTSIRMNETICEYTSENIIARIPLDNKEKTVYITRNYYGRGERIETLQISLIDKHCNIIDLNSCDFSFVLEITIEE
jgi:hypothetical protein